MFATPIPMRYRRKKTVTASKFMSTQSKDLSGMQGLYHRNKVSILFTAACIASAIFAGELASNALNHYQTQSDLSEPSPFTQRPR